MAATLKADLHENGILVVSIGGMLDASGVEAVVDGLDEAISHYTGPVIADLSAVDYLSSAGLALLVSRGKRQRGRGGDLVVVANSQRLLEVFDLTGFGGLFSVYETMEDALAGIDEMWRE